MSSVDSVESKYHGYMHTLYIYATKYVGAQSGFGAIAIAMNMKSRSPSGSRSAISLSRYQVNNWFISNNGKEYLAVDNPLDIADHRKKCLVWVREHHFNLMNEYT